MDDQHNNNSSIAPMNNLTNTNLLETINTDKEDYEEEESQNAIIKRVITSKIATPCEELKISQVNELLYILIRFDCAFSSDKINYNWIVYHTPKEVRNHIKKMYEKIANREIQTSFPIHPIIIQLKSDQDVTSNLIIINDFYNKLFSDPNVQNNQFLNNFFNIGGTSFLKMNRGN